MRQPIDAVNRAHHSNPAAIALRRRVKWVRIAGIVVWFGGFLALTAFLGDPEGGWTRIPIVLAWLAFVLGVITTVAGNVMLQPHSPVPNPRVHRATGWLLVGCAVVVIALGSLPAWNIASWATGQRSADVAYMGVQFIVLVQSLVLAVLLAVVGALYFNQSRLPIVAPEGTTPEQAQ